MAEVRLPDFSFSDERYYRHLDASPRPAVGEGEEHRELRDRIHDGEQRRDDFQDEGDVEGKTAPLRRSKPLSSSE